MLAPSDAARCTMALAFAMFAALSQEQANCAAARVTAVIASHPRFLLCDAVDAAAALHDVERIDLHDVAPGEASGDDLAGIFVVTVAEGRHNHRAVRKIEVDIAHRQ